MQQELSAKRVLCKKFGDVQGSKILECRNCYAFVRLEGVCMHKWRSFAGSDTRAIVPYEMRPRLPHVGVRCTGKCCSSKPTAGTQQPAETRRATKQQGSLG